MTKVRVFREELIRVPVGAPLCGDEHEYAARVGARVIRSRNLERLLSELQTAFLGDVRCVFDWEPPTDPDDVHINNTAAALYAQVFGAAYLAGFPIERDGGGAPRNSPYRDAEQAAKRAVELWRREFYPDTLRPPTPYGRE